MKSSPTSSSVLTIRVPKSLDRRLATEARRQRMTRSEVARAILEDALNKPDEDPAVAARRQSILASRRNADAETLEFLDAVADEQGWQ